MSHLSGTTTTVTIVDNETVPTLSVADTTLNVMEDNANGNVTFDVTLSHPTEKEVTVSYATAEGTATDEASPTATDNHDFTAISSGTATIAPTMVRGTNNLSDTITIVINDDDISENFESFSVNLSNAANAEIEGTPATIRVVVTIEDDDSNPTLSAALEAGTSPMINEETGSAAPAKVVLSLGSALNVPVDVYFSTSIDTYTPTENGTNPAEESDFGEPTPEGVSPPSGMVTFAPGEEMKTIVIPIIGDDSSADGPTFEGNETFTFNIDSVSGAMRSATPSVQITIEDDEDAPVVTLEEVTVDGDNVKAASGNDVNIDTVGLSVHENVESGNVEIPLKLSIQTEHVVKVRYEVKRETNDTATNDVDFDSTEDDSGDIRTFEFMPGDPLEQMIEVSIINDGVYEGNETFTINLLNYQVGHFANVDMNNDITVTIIDDDDSDVPILSFSEVNIVADEMNEMGGPNNDMAGVKNIQFEISRPTAFPVTIEYYTTEGSADAGDFTGVSSSSPGTVTIPATPALPNASNTTAIIQIPITPDNIYEDNENFTVTISSITSEVTQGVTTARFTTGLSELSAVVTIPNSQEAPYDSNSFDPIPTLTIDDTQSHVTAASAEVPASQGPPPSPLVPAMPVTVTVAEDAGNVRIPVILSNGNENPVRFVYSTSLDQGEGAAEFNDFNPRVNQPQVIANGTTADLLIPIVPDLGDVYEGDETFTVTISSVTNAVFAGTDTEIPIRVVIQDSSALPELTVASTIEVL